MKTVAVPGSENHSLHSTTLLSALVNAPKSVLWLESSWRNFSRRVFSRTVIGGAPEAFWSEILATRGMMGLRGRDCCLWSGFLRHVSPEGI